MAAPNILTTNTQLSGVDPVTGSLMFVNGKLGMTSAADIADYSAASAVRKLGPVSTKLVDNVAATTTNWTDLNANNIYSWSKFTFSTNTATNHNYAGGATPTVVMACVTGTATATSFGTFTSTQVTPAETTPAATTALAAVA